MILVLNPNSSTVVTEALRGALCRIDGSGARFIIDQLDDAPAEINSPADHEAVAPQVLQYLNGAGHGHAAVVLACHGDPAIRDARARSHCPVLGIGETSMHAAAAAADRFAVLTLGTALVDRKWAQARAAGLADRCAAIEPTETSVLHGLSEDPDLTPYRAAADRALDAGAGALVLGCAGMVTLADRLSEEYDVPVIEPVAVTCALAAAISLPHAD